MAAEVLRIDKAEWESVVQPWELEFWREHGLPDAGNSDGELSRQVWEILGFPVDYFQGRRVLDVGCGPTGRCDAMEGAFDAIEPLAGRYREMPEARLGKYATVREHPIEEHHSEIDGLYDAIVSLNALDHCYDLGAALRNIRSYLRSGGEAVISMDCDQEGPTDGHPLIVEHRTVERMMIDAGFSIRRRSGGRCFPGRTNWGHGTAWTWELERPAFWRTDDEWQIVCEDGITAGHVPDRGKEWMYEEGRALQNNFMEFPPSGGDAVLDIGCGNGRLAMALLPYCGIRYLGLDPINACVDFCRSAFRPWEARYEFRHAPIQNDIYSPAEPVRVCEWKFPVDDESVDWAAALSVFVHLGNEETAWHYVSEFLRVLKPGGMFWNTWFRSPPNDVLYETVRMTYPEATIIDMLRPFRWLHTFQGVTTAKHDQWHVWVRKE